MADNPSIAVPFKEAEDFLRNKVRLGTKAWTDISQGMHAKAFVSAGVARGAILEDLHSAVVKGVEGGLTRQEFRKQFDVILADRGWPFNAPDSKGYRDWRAGVIFDTNLRMAYQAGHWKQMQETAESRPYLEYVAVDDERTRPLHREWDGTILPIDHPWWKTHYPPNGWNCRCTVVSRSAADLKRLGKAVSVAPQSELVDRQITIDGERTTIQVPKGIDPGFDYNVGEAAWGTGQPIELRDKEVWKPLTRFGQAKPDAFDPGPAPSPTTPKSGLAPQIEKVADVETALTDRIVKLAGDRIVQVADPTGESVTIDAQLLAKHLADNLRSSPRDRREQYLPLLLEAIQEPQEIWQGFEVASNGKVRLSRRYVYVVDLKGDGEPRLLALVMNVRGGAFTAWTTFMAGQLKYLNSGLRSGVRIYKKEE